jgi:hypothetical protein
LKVLEKRGGEENKDEGKIKRENGKGGRWDGK